MNLYVQSSMSSQFCMFLIVHTGAIVEVEAGVDTAEDTLVLEVAPTEVPIGKY